MPNLTFLKDTDGDDKADVQQVAAQRLRHRGFAPRPARFHLDARRRSALPRVDLSSFAGRNALRPGAAAEQRLVPLSAANASADELWHVSQHQPLGRDVRRLGQARRQPPDLCRRVSRARSALSRSSIPRPTGLRAYSGTCGQEFVDFATFPAELQGHFIKVRYKPTNRVEIHKWIEGDVRLRRGVRQRPDLLDEPELHPGRSQVRPARRSVRLRLVQPGEGPRAVFAARRAPRPALGPHLADHGQGQAAAGAAADRRRVDSRAARDSEAARVSPSLLGQARAARARCRRGASGARRLGRAASRPTIRGSGIISSRRSGPIARSARRTPSCCASCWPATTITPAPRPSQQLRYWHPHLPDAHRAAAQGGQRSERPRAHGGGDRGQLHRHEGGARRDARRAQASARRAPGLRHHLLARHRTRCGRTGKATRSYNIAGILQAGQPRDASSRSRRPTRRRPSSTASRT